MFCDYTWKLIKATCYLYIDENGCVRWDSRLHKITKGRKVKKVKW